MFDTSFNNAVISKAALRHNYRYLSDRTKVPVLAMVKADAYGHGAIEAARVFSEVGCRSFGVAELREAVALREAGIGGEILVTIGFPREACEQIFHYDLTPVIYDYEAGVLLASRAAQYNKPLKIHVKVDSGMGRLGLEPEDVVSFVDKLSEVPGWRFGGLMSHFPEADQPQKNSTKDGYKAFAGACRELTSRYGGCCHIANSAAILNYPETHCQMVRAGIALYGYHPQGRSVPGDAAYGELQPAMSFTTEILQVKKFAPGRGISYGRTYTTERDSLIAVVPVGYEDGLSRSLSNRGTALVGGQRVPVRGRICMNMCMLDVTGVPAVKPGDPVVFLGVQGREAISADDIAELTNTISYEVLCLFGNNNNRKYIS